MTVKTIPHTTLSHVTYLICSGKEAALVDPLRGEVNYEQLIAEEGVTLKYIFLTHAYLDLLTDHVDIAEKMGAQIVIGAEFQPKFRALQTTAGQEFALGNISIVALPTPGYSLDSQSWLVMEEQEAKAVFVGRAINYALISLVDGIWSNTNKEELASKLYDTLFIKLGLLPESIMLYQSSDLAGSITLGAAKETWSIFKSEDKETFIKEAIQQTKEWPIHYQDLKSLNLKTIESVSEIMEQVSHSIPNIEFEVLVKDHNIQLVDIRPQQRSSLGYIPKSLLLGLEGHFEYWMLRLINPEKAIILIAEDELKANQAMLKLQSVGLKNIKGFIIKDIYLKDHSRASLDMIIDVDVEEFILDLKFDDKISPLDVRSNEEFDNSHLQSVQHIPLQHLNEPLHMSAIDESLHYYVYSEDQYRAIAACSLLKREGFDDVRYVSGGYKSIQEQDGVVIMVPKKDHNEQQD